MGDFILSRNEQYFIQTQTDFNTIPNSTGTATLAAANVTRGINFKANNQVGILTRRDKTGYRTPTLGNKGRGFGKWSLEASLTTGGAAGVLPDLDPFFQALFGAAGVVVASTSVTYTPADVLKYFVLWTFAKTITGGDADARCAFGCIPTQATFNINQDVAEFTAEGECKWVARSKGFGGLAADLQGGLSAFPAVPGSTPTFHGPLVQGFLGIATLGGNVLSDHLVSAQIVFRTGGETVKNTFGTVSPSGAEADERNVGVSFSLYDDDGAEVELLKAASETKTPVDLSFKVGQTAGAFLTFNLKNVLLGDCDTDASAQRRRVVNFSQGRAYGTSPSSHDEMTLVLT